jgi:hypothetical protein
MIPLRGLPKAELEYEWSVDRSGNIKELEEKATVGTLKVEGHYYVKKNVTKIKKKMEKPGLVIISFTTSKGTIGVSY